MTNNFEIKTIHFKNGNVIKFRRKKVYTDIIILLDRSGSMQTIKNDMVGGLEEFIKEQRKIKGRAKVTMYQFDNEFEELFKAKDIREDFQFKLEPRGVTALLDAIGKSIKDTTNRLKNMKNKPDKIAFLIITDGQENASIEYTRKAIKSLIEEKTKEDWEFVYIGANQDAFAEGASFGVQGSNTLNYSANSRGVKTMFSAVSQTLGSYRENGGNWNFEDDKK